uniref:DUF913 domain-containing protein n=1 Tax=Globodera pallida TaxID=36090 RepID=A0A183BXQ5_GLOPA
MIKLLLNLLKRSVLDVNLVHIRQVMETELPSLLIQIFGKPDYYGQSVMLCAITLTTTFISEEPAQLATLQDLFPTSRELVFALPNVCSALCLNERGLNDLKEFGETMMKPLRKMFRFIFLSEFLLSMRRRETEMGDICGPLFAAFSFTSGHVDVLIGSMITELSRHLDESTANYEEVAEQFELFCQLREHFPNDSTRALKTMPDRNN